MAFELLLEALVRFGAWKMGKGYDKQRKMYVEKGTGMAGGVVQVVEHLPGRLEALNSNSSTAKKKIHIYR
jgi:hypothetical protein